MHTSAIDPGVIRRRVARMGRLADVRLRAIASRLEPVDAELSQRIRELAGHDLLSGMTENIRSSVLSFEDRLSEMTGLAFFDGNEFAAGMDTGDFSSFTEQLAGRFEVLPTPISKLWHGHDLDGEDLEAVAALAATAGGAAPTTWWTTVVRLAGLVNELIMLFVDTTEENNYSCGSVEVRTLSLLETTFTGLDSDQAKQPLQAKYVVEFDGEISEACVTFNCRFTGSRLDKVDYPISAKATMANGSTLALTPEVVADSDYNELHKVAIFANARTVEISVNGTAHWAPWLGSLSSVGSVPHGTVCAHGQEHRFGDRDAIWTYGWSR